MSVEFGRHLQMVRQLRCMSIAEVAQRAHIPKSSIYAYEQGRNEPKISFALAIAEVLNVSLDYLVKGVKR